MTDRRIYLVTFAEKVRLVRAANVAQAIRHVARDTISAVVPSQDDLLRYGRVMDVEEASSAPAESVEAA